MLTVFTDSIWIVIGSVPHSVHCLRHEKHQQKENEYIHTDKSIDNSVELIDLEFVFALIQNEFGIHSCVEHHGVDFVRVFQNTPSWHEVLEAELGSFVAMLHHAFESIDVFVRRYVLDLSKIS